VYHRPVSYFKEESHKFLHSGTDVHAACQ
jgi:hypothetical protein